MRIWTYKYRIQQLLISNMECKYVYVYAYMDIQIPTYAYMDIQIPNSTALHFQRGIWRRDAHRQVLRGYTLCRKPSF